MRRQLRAIGGPLSGAVYVIEGRTRLGRAGDSDIQLVHDGVSRHHAQIVEDEVGQLMLVDLSSNNGTFVHGERIDRHHLSHGDEFRILRTRFAYEEVEEQELPPDSATAEVYAVKVTTAETLRNTVDHWSSDLPAPVDRSTATDNTVRRPPTPREPPAERIVEGPGPRRHAVVALTPDGSPYRGDILSDIQAYRALRLRQLREEVDNDLHTVTRYTKLRAQLHQPSDPDPRVRQRKFRRFRCTIPARLRFGGLEGDRTAHAVVVDLGAGGARIACDQPFEQGDLLWLVIDLVVRARSRTMVFTSRVVNVHAEGEYGLIFAGAPEWEDWKLKKARKKADR